MNSQNLQVKQNYLHFEIIEKQYDPEEFQQFMSNQKGLNLDEYSMNQLVQLVKTFQKITNESESQTNNYFQNTNGIKNIDNTHIKDQVQPPFSPTSQNKEKLSQQKNLQEQKSFSQKNQEKQEKIELQQSKPSKQEQKVIEKVQNQTGKKFGIDLKKMIIPQFKPQQDKIKQQQNKIQQKNSKNVESQPISSKDTLFKKDNKTSQIMNPLNPPKLIQQSNGGSSNTTNLIENKTQSQLSFEKKRNTSKIYYQQDEDDNQRDADYDQAFIGQNGFIEQNKLPEPKISNHRYNQTATESFYIPSTNTKLPFLISNKSTTSSLFKEIKSFIRIDKDGKQKNEFFDGFAIKINSFTKKQSNSIFRFPYITYNVETIFGNQKEGNMKSIKDQNLPKNRVWKVQRRFNDFKWLHDYMQKSYFGTPIPPIPAKTKMRSFDDEHLQQRMIVFERFLGKCIHIDEIASDPVFEAFLSIQSREELEAVKKKFGDKLKSRDQNMMQFLKGEEILDFSRGITSISYNTKSFFVKSSDLLSSLNNQLISLQHNLKLASRNSVTASNILRQLSQIYKSNHEYEVRGAAMFDVVSEYVGQLSYKLDNEAYSLKKFVGNCWMYEEMYQKNILNYINSLDKHKNILETKFKDLHMSKNSQLNTQQVNQSFASTQSTGSSNFKTKQLYKKTKQLYEINLSLAIQEITRYLQQDLLILSKQFSHGISKYVERLKDEMMVGVDLMTKVMTVGEGKQLKEVQLISKNLIKSKNQEKQLIQ